MVELTDKGSRGESLYNLSINKQSLLMLSENKQANYSFVGSRGTISSFLFKIIGILFTRLGNSLLGYYIAWSVDVRPNPVGFPDFQSILVFPTFARQHLID